MALASVRSSRGMGVGEFNDLKRLADMCARAGLRFIEVLPVTDTCAHPHAPWQDLSPYATISAHALNPLHLRLSVLPDLPRDLAREVQTQTHRFNGLATLACSRSPSQVALHIGGRGERPWRESAADGDLEEGAKRGCGARDIAGDRDGCGRTGTRAAASQAEDVLAAKHKLLRRVYEMTGKKVVESAEFASFLTEHARWLKPYSLFCVLRDLHGNADVSQWGEMGRLSAAHIDALVSPGGSKYAACRYWIWLQFHLHNQLREAARYAASKGVALMGHLPSSINLHAVDVWAQPDLFRRDKVWATCASSRVHVRTHTYTHGYAIHPPDLFWRDKVHT